MLKSSIANCKGADQPMQPNFQTLAEHTSLRLDLKILKAGFVMVVVVLGFYVPPTAKVIWRRDLGLKSHPKDWFCYGVVSERRCHGMVSVSKNRHLSHVMRRPAFCICENKEADQLRGNHEADQCLCFPYIDSTIPLLY